MNNGRGSHRWEEEVDHKEGEEVLPAAADGGTAKSWEGKMRRSPAWPVSLTSASKEVWLLESTQVSCGRETILNKTCAEHLAIQEKHQKTAALTFRSGSEPNNIYSPTHTRTFYGEHSLRSYVCPLFSILSFLFFPTDNKSTKKGKKKKNL